MNPSLFKTFLPFEGRYLTIDGLRLHYLDEGSGHPVVMLHGNPTWCFYYRNLVAALRGEYRCIVPDHMGMGLSEKPDDSRYTYTLERRVDDLERLLESVGVRGPLTLVMHDWGGMIGMAYALRHPERPVRIVAMNTSAFHLPKTKPFPWQLKLARTAPGAFLIRGCNAFARSAASVGCKRHPMARDLRNAYCAPYGNWADRIAVLRFVQDIPLHAGDPAYQLVTQVQSFAPGIRAPLLLCWGMKDFVFDHHFLDLWTAAFPQAEVHRFQDCGHYILEDAAEEVIPLIQDFLKRNPVS